MGLFGRKSTEKRSFKVEGMTCEHCQKSIEEGLKEMAGVGSAKVSLKKSSAQIIYDPQEVTLDAVSKKIEELGYKALIE